MGASAAIVEAAEVEMELQGVVGVEALVTHVREAVPFTLCNLERDISIRSTSKELNHHQVGVGCLVEAELRRDAVREVGVEQIEVVAKSGLGRWVVRVVVSSVVVMPLKT